MSRQKQIVSPSEILDAMSGKKTNFSESYSDTNQIILRDIILQENLVINDLTCQSSISFVNCELCGYIHIRGGRSTAFQFLADS